MYKGAFNNYVNKKRGWGKKVSRKSMGVTRQRVIDSIFVRTRGEGVKIGQNLVYVVVE